MLTLKYKNLLFFLKSEWKKNLTKLLFAQSVHQDTFSPEMQKEKYVDNYNLKLQKIKLAITLVNYFSHYISQYYLSNMFCRTLAIKNKTKHLHVWHLNEGNERRR